MNSKALGPIVVTGATGFVGRHLVEALTARGRRVRALVRDPGRWGTVRDDVELYTLDLLTATPEQLLELVRGASQICHAAAFLPPNYQAGSFAETCLRVNALGTLSLLEAAAGAGVVDFVHFSSGNVYTPQPGRVTEEAAIYPSWRAPYYLASKVCAEVWVDHFRRARGLNAVILRVSSVYGPGMGCAGMVPTFAARLRAHEPLIIQDGGRFKSDLVQVADVVDAAVRALERRATGVFNIGSGRESSSLEVATAMLGLFGRDTSFLRVEPAGAGDTPTGFSALDIGRAREHLGYAPGGLRDGLSRYVASLE